MTANSLSSPTGIHIIDVGKKWHFSLCASASASGRVGVFQQPQLIHQHAPRVSVYGIVSTELPVEQVFMVIF